MPPSQVPYGGICADTSVVANLLRVQGIVNPLTKQPFSEALVLGLGQGISANYFNFEYTGYPPMLSIWFSPVDVMGPLGVLGTTCNRLGLRWESHESGGAKQAQADLDTLLDSGRPALAYVAGGALPWRKAPEEWEGGSYHRIGIRGRDPKSGGYLIDDLATKPFAIDAVTLAHARSRIKRDKQRLQAIGSDQQVSAEALRKGIVTGVKGAVATLNNPKMQNFGLSAIEKWAKLLANTKDKKGWPTVFAPGPALFSGLKGMHDGIVYGSLVGGSDGAALRELFGDFCLEAGELTKNKSLTATGTQYHALAKEWRGFAEAAFPASIPVCKQARAALATREKALRSGKTVELTTAEQRFVDPIGSNAVDWPLSEAKSMALLQTLSAQLLAIHAQEVAACQALAKSL